MRTKVTLALIFLNVALYFFIFQVRPWMSGATGTEELSRQVLPSAATDIREIELTVGADTTKLVRRGEQWCIAAPIDWPANPVAIEHMLTTLQSLKHETSFTVDSLTRNKRSLADYGLEKPAMAVSLTAAQTSPGEQPRRYTLKVGNTTNVENRLYVLSADSTRIHVVSRALAESLTLPLEQLRASSLFTIPDYEVRNFTIQPSSAVSARTRIRRDGTRWAMENPVQTRANAAAVRTTLAQLAGLQIENFISQPLSPELSPSASTTLRITLEGNNRSETLLIGAPVPREGTQATRTFYAQFEWKIDGERKSAVFTVALAPALLESLRAAQERLRETRIVDVDTSTLVSLTLRAPGQPDLLLQRLEATGSGEGARWQLVRRVGDTAPVTLPADPDAVKSLLEQLALLNATRFVTDAPGPADLESWGFNRPERTIILQAEESPAQRSASAGPALPPQAPPSAQVVSLELGLGSERSTKAFARLDTARYIYEVDSEILHRTRTDPRLWRDRRLQTLPAGARITALHVTDLKTGAVVAECRFQAPASGTASGDGTPPATLPEEQRAAWSTVAASVRTLRARSFVSEHFSANYTLPGGEAPWRYRLTADITLQTGAGEQSSTQTLSLSERLGGTSQLAGSAELDALFELEQPAVDALWTLLYQDRDPGPLALIQPGAQEAALEQTGLKLQPEVKAPTLPAQQDVPEKDALLQPSPQPAPSVPTVPQPAQTR